MINVAFLTDLFKNVCVSYLPLSEMRCSEKFAKNTCGDGNFKHELGSRMHGRVYMPYLQGTVSNAKYY